jgi:hypothetical protein
MMISGRKDSRLVLVLQTDHSRVAGLLAAHWGNAEFAEPAPYASMVLAAQEHDGGWWDWEIRPTLSREGYPIDYVGSIKQLGAVWLDFYRHGIERVAERDPYAGLIVLLHAVELCTNRTGLVPHLPDYSSSPELSEGLGHLETRRRELLGRLRGSDAYRAVATDEHLARNLQLMEALDQLAQFVCNRYPFNSTERKNGPKNRIGRVPVGPGREDVTLAVDVLDEARARLHPYPFDRSPLSIPIPARLLPDRAWTSQEEFLRDYYKAESCVITYSLQAE